MELRAGDCEVLVEDEGPGFPADLLARFSAGLTLEEVLHPPDAPARRGLGAGLDSARRLTAQLTLENRPGRGALARARMTRATVRRG